MKHLENGEYLCAVEISTKQNYNLIDGKRNNIETPKEAKPGRDKTSLLERLKEKQQLLISGAEKRTRKRKASAICRKQFEVWDDVMSIVPYPLFFYFEKFSVLLLILLCKSRFRSIISANKAD